MRVLATIIVVFSAVTTAGPLRCPCQLVTLLRSPAHSNTVAAAAPTTFNCHGCACQSHAHPDESRPTEKPPERPEPCKHGPAVDLVAPIAGGDRQLGDREAGESSFTAPGDLLAVLPTRCPITPLFATAGPHPSTAARLRYCHSFLC